MSLKNIGDIPQKFTVGQAWVGTKVYRDEYVEALAAELALKIDAMRCLEDESQVLFDRVKELEAALIGIAGTPGPDHLMDIDAKRMRDAARKALTPAETETQRDSKP